MQDRTYFGLEIINDRGVRPSDITALPFPKFWFESAIGSSQFQDEATGAWLFHLHDWRAFCLLFIETGRHRYMAQPKKVFWFDQRHEEPERTYFGVAMTSDKKGRVADIATLPFYSFWARSDEAMTLTRDSVTGESGVPLRDWETFCLRFIRSGT